MKETDEHILNSFKEILFYNGPLHLKKSNTFEQNSKTYFRKAQKTLTINSIQTFKCLHKQGLYPNKSLTLQFPTEEQVPKELQRHFIRGYFDGDGCITKKGQISFIGSDCFINYLNVLINKMEIESKVHKIDKISVINIHKKKYMQKFFNFLYKDGTYYLDRKFERFNKILN